MCVFFYKNSERKGKNLLHAISEYGKKVAEQMGITLASLFRVMFLLLTLILLQAE